jgi:hypothetical protein
MDAPAPTTPTVELPVRLQGCQPLACGVQRLVYSFPGHPDLIIKVLRPDYVEARIGPGSRLASRLRRCREYHAFHREIREYLAACARPETCLPLLPPFLGLVQTDRGLGMVMLKVCDRNGSLAPTMAQLIREGRMNPARTRMLDAFLASLVDSRVVLNDLHPGNVVLATDPDGSERFVLVDGIGNAALLPTKSLVGAFNRWSKLRQTRRLRACVDDAAS